jgi:GrpB-like predicted nucleotidyltransferase (UPF0157 family)
MSKRILSLVPYQDNWPALYQQERALLVPLLGDNLIQIDHIGSTSVIGLAAKPIIDILIEVKSLSSIDKLTAQFQELGYLAKGENGIAGRRYFQKGGNQRSHHLHIFEKDDEQLVKHRAFRDYLLKFPAIAQQYSDIKHKALLEANNDSQLYTELKSSFIQEHTNKALRLFFSQQI